MSRFRDELRVIPAGAMITAAIIIAISAAGAVFLMPRHEGFMLIAGLPMAVIFALYVPLAGYVYSDARRRGMRYVVWTLLAIFIPNGIGIILYFLLREPLQRSCPACGVSSKSGLAFCPNCGAPLGRSCPQCKCRVEETWRNCAHCGAVV